MSNFTRRDLFKTGIAASAIVAEQTGAAAQSQPPATSASPSPGALRERLSLDFGLRFHLGHADDPVRDFGWGKSGDSFAKSGQTIPAATEKFDDSGWRKVDLPHDWAIELPFEHNPRLNDKRQASEPAVSPIS